MSVDVSSPPASAGIQIHTVATVSYLPFVSVLIDSLRERDPGHRFSVLVTDVSRGRLDAVRPYFAGRDVTLSCCGDLDAPMLARGREYYSALEFNSACKVLHTAHLVRGGASESLFIDPDMLVLDALVARLKSAGTPIVVTPHSSAPFPDDGDSPTNLEMAVSGHVNGGVFFVRRTQSTLAALDWLAEQTPFRWFVAPTVGMYGDQQWLSMLPYFYAEETTVLADPTINIAYWNLHERRLRLNGDRVEVQRGGADWTGARLFHFSGIAMPNDGRLTQHSTRTFDAATIAAVQQTLAEYVARLTAARRNLEELGCQGDLGFSTAPLNERMKQAEDVWGLKHTTPPTFFERAGRKMDRLLFTTLGRPR